MREKPLMNKYDFLEKLSIQEPEKALKFLLKQDFWDNNRHWVNSLVNIWNSPVLSSQFKLENSFPLFYSLPLTFELEALKNDKLLPNIWIPLLRKLLSQDFNNEAKLILIEKLKNLPNNDLIEITFKNDALSEYVIKEILK